MNEGFEEWNKLKQSLHAKIDFPHPKRRQIWWCAIGLNVGKEQGCADGFERPVLVVKVFGNLFWGLPITSSDPKNLKEKNPLFYKLENISYLNDSDEEKTLHGFAALHQLRVYDGRRLRRKIARIDVDSFEPIAQKIRGLL